MVAAPTETDNVELPPALTEAGLRLAVTPAGAPLTLRLTVPAAPEVTAVLIVALPAAPWATLIDAGLALIEKSFTTGTGTVNETVVLCVFAPSVPLTVRV
jgi:hypothetical protein